MRYRRIFIYNKTFLHAGFNKLEFIVDFVAKPFESFRPTFSKGGAVKGAEPLSPSAKAKRNAQRKSGAPLFACGVYGISFLLSRERRLRPRLSEAKKFSFVPLVSKKKAGKQLR